MKTTLLAAASSVAIALLSVPAAAQHAGHDHAPAPAPKAPPAPAEPAAKEPAAETPTTPDHSTMDHSTMDHSPEKPATPDHSAMDHSTMDHGAMAPADHAGHDAMAGALGPYPMTRESSGTAWQPDTSEHAGVMTQAGDWHLMGHGTLNLVYDHQGGPRGDDKAFVSGMLMGMARRPLGDGTLQFRAMLSPEPLMGKRGYPLLLASGETADGVEHLIDRQHPHEFFMELSGSISQNIGPKSSVFLWRYYT